MNNDEMSAFSKQRFEFQKTLFEKGVEQIQVQILHLDNILFKIKASSITVWVALIGWGVTTGTVRIIPLGIVVIIGFWLLEAMFKGAQLRYIEISTNLMHIVNDTDSLQNQFEEQCFQADLIYPVALKLTEVDRISLTMRGLISSTVATGYLFLALANMLVWLMIG